MHHNQAQARCHAEIDLPAIGRNALRAQTLVPDALVIPVLKGNAYGLGTDMVGKTLFEMGMRFFAVATVAEGLALLQCAPADVLVMGAAGEPLYEAAISAGLILTVYSLDQAHALNDTANRLSMKARAHFKVDTGLHRLGFEPGTAAEQITQCTMLSNLDSLGLFTHLGLHNERMDAVQIARFNAVRESLKARGITLFTHALDSIGMVRYPQWHMDAVRVGAWLYGVSPCGSVERPEPVVTIRARIAQIRMVSAGELIGYNDDIPLKRKTRIATLSCGYADGIPRLSGRGDVIVDNRRCPVLGPVCMDQMMVDITDCPNAREGGTATLLGDGITIEEYAQSAGFNRNEALARLSSRMERIYRTDDSASPATE